MDPPPPLSDQLSRQAAWTRRLARGLLGDESAAEDTLQETWEAASRRPPHTGAPVEPWLRRTIRNRMLNRAREQRRRDAREQKTIPGAPPDSPEQLLARLEIHRQLVEAVSRLAEPYRQALLLRYFEEQTSAQIAARLNIPAATVRGRVKTAVDLLREELDRGPGGRKAWMGMVLLLAGRGGQLGPEPVVTVVKVVMQSLVVKVALVVALIAAVTVTVQVATAPAPAGAPPVAEVPRLPPGPKPLERMVAPPSIEPPSAPVAARVVASVAPAPSPAPAVVPLFSISGRVHLAGAPASRPLLDMSADPFCAGQPRVEDDAVLVDREGRLENAVVRIAGGPSMAASLPAQAVVIEQQGCRYRPRVVVAQAGQLIEFRNRDHTVHAVHGWVGPASSFTGSLAAGTPPLFARAPAAGQSLRLKCDVHPWMAATVLATENQHVSITDREGRYTLRGIPAGTYRVEAWHEVHHRSSIDVTVGPGQITDEIDLFLGVYPRGTPGSCLLARRYDGPVRSACRDGGIKKAKLVMKAMVKRGKERGLKLECDDCHKDEAAGNWTLTPDAHRRFDQLLHVARFRP